MRAVRELRAPPRTADRESFERGIAPHPEYAGGGEAMSLLYPDRLTLKAQPGPLITIPSGGSMAAAPPAIAVAARNITDMRPAGSRSSQRHQFDAASLLYPEKAAAAAPFSGSIWLGSIHWYHRTWETCDERAPIGIGANCPSRVPTVYCPRHVSLPGRLCCRARATVTAAARAESGLPNVWPTMLPGRVVAPQQRPRPRGPQTLQCSPGSQC